MAEKRYRITFHLADGTTHSGYIAIPICDSGSVSEEAIRHAVEEYLKENPVEGGSVSAEEVERIVDEYLAENPPEDGFSPLVSVTDITGGHRVSITDKDGEKSFDVLNGKDGTGGGGSGGGGAEWELLQQVNVPLDGEETWNFNITFPRGYDDYLVIANTAATSTNANTIIYPSPLVINQDNNVIGGTWAFWDYYPGTTAQRFNLLFEKIEVNGVVYCRMSGIAPTNALGKPNGIADSGWFSYDSYPGTPRKLVGWNGVKIERKIAPGSGYVLLGRKSV